MNIIQQTKIEHILECIPEKFIVDLVNGIDIVNDHIRVQKQTGFFARLYQGLNGSSHIRQTEINALLNNNVKSSLVYLRELTELHAHCNLAINTVNNKIDSLLLGFDQLVNYTNDIKQQLTSLAHQMNNRCSIIEQEITRIDFNLRAHQHLDKIFYKWSAGRYSSFSLAGRCYAAMEELYWGDFGDYCRSHSADSKNDFIEQLINRAISQLATDAGCKVSSRLNTYDWLTQPNSYDVLPDASDTLAYMGDWSGDMHAPFVYAISQQPEELPLTVPLISSPTRIIEALVTDIFEERINA